MAITLQESIVRSKAGSLTIDTPHAACDLYYILLERYELDPKDGIVEIKYVEHGVIEFRVKSVIFRFVYQPGKLFALFCRHAEGERWYNANFDNTNHEPAKHIVNLVSKHAFDEVPSPI